MQSQCCLQLVPLQGSLWFNYISLRLEWSYNRELQQSCICSIQHFLSTSCLACRGSWIQYFSQQMESHLWFYIELKRGLQFHCISTGRMEIWAYLSRRILWIARSCFSLSSKIRRNFIWWAIIRAIAWWWWINGFWIWYWLNISSINNRVAIVISKLRFFSKRTDDVLSTKFLNRVLQPGPRWPILNSFGLK